MINGLIEKYRSLVVVDKEGVALQLQTVLQSMSEEEVIGLFAHSSRAGIFLTLKHKSAPGLVLEFVPDQANETPVITIYQDHPIFQSKQSLIDAREEIIACIDKHFMAIPNIVTVMDGGRNKECFLVELGTAQLLDVLGLLSEKSVH